HLSLLSLFLVLFVPRPAPKSTHCPYTTLFRSEFTDALRESLRAAGEELDSTRKRVLEAHPDLTLTGLYNVLEKIKAGAELSAKEDRKSTRLNSSHVKISYAVFCLKKKRTWKEL